MINRSSLLKKLKLLLYNFDLFGRKINLNIKKEEVYHTTVGSIASLLILLFIAYTFISMFLEMIEMSDPAIIWNSEFNRNPEV